MFVGETLVTADEANDIVGETLTAEEANEVVFEAGGDGGLADEATDEEALAELFDLTVKKDEEAKEGRTGADAEVDAEAEAEAMPEAAAACCTNADAEDGTAEARDVTELARDLTVPDTDWPFTEFERLEIFLIYSEYSPSPSLSRSINFNA